VSAKSWSSRPVPHFSCQLPSPPRHWCLHTGFKCEDVRGTLIMFGFMRCTFVWMYIPTCAITNTIRFTSTNCDVFKPRARLMPVSTGVRDPCRFSHPQSLITYIRARIFGPLTCCGSSEASAQPHPSLPGASVFRLLPHRMHTVSGVSVPSPHRP
jgi:hypothetical protein